MEVGAVKQAFNNELILMKKKLNQAKIQVIHKLTRKAKTLTDKKVPDKLKEKLNRKAESAVKEVLIIKKIKAKDIAKFMITHTEELKNYLNRPVVDLDKACARLALHKVMNDKYKFIRGRFGNVPIKDLFMSRQERIKLKKEAREKQKNKKKGKEPNKSDNTLSEWKIEDINIENDGDNINDEMASSNEGDNDSHIEQDNDDSDMANSGSDISEEELEENLEESAQSDNEQDDREKISENDDQVKVKSIETTKSANFKESLEEDEVIRGKNEKSNKKPEKKHKVVNKNRNFNDKILQRKFKKDTDDSPFMETKVVDPFFITSTGDKYMSVAESRQPDEIKEIHKQGNRKLRRAAMFGHVPRVKPKRDHFKGDNQNAFNKYNNTNKYNRDFIDESDNFNNFNRRKGFDDQSNAVREKPEKLHPSWEAKKRQSGILPFEGKKIVFDES